MLANLVLQEVSNYTAIAKKFSINHITLLQCYRGKIVKKDTQSCLYLLLSYEQQRCLVNLINQLINHELPSTAIMIY